MVKWLRYDTAKANKVYREIVDDASERLGRVGHFAKEEVLYNTGYDVLGDEGIRWDYVKRMIEEKHDTELVPLTASYFRRHQAEEENLKPERFITSNVGKRAAGFAIISDQNGHLVIKHLNHKRGRAEGAVKSTNETLRKAKRVMPVLEPSRELPAIEDWSIEKEAPSTNP